MIIFTNRFIPDRFAAYTVAFIILMRPTHRADYALIAHERTHVKQFWRTLGLHGLMYPLSEKYRYKSELEAHRVEYQMAPERLDRLASSLARNYGLEISFGRAREEISK
jgi:hypothetical protein